MNNDNKAKKTAPVRAADSSAAPKVSYTGSRKQPMSLDSEDDSDSDSDDSSMLEVLAPQKQTKKMPPPANVTKSLPVASKKRPSVAPAKAKPQYILGDTSDSDSDDSLLNGEPLFASSSAAATGRQAKKHGLKYKELEKERKKQEQERKKQEKLVQKQAEQARKKAERQALKEQKQAKKQAETDSRKRQRLEQQQQRGNFATQEIVLLVDPPLFRRPETHHCYDWKEHDECVKHSCLVQEYPSALGGPNCHALQWIRRDHLQGGASEAWQQLRQNNAQGYTHQDRLVIVMDDPKVFIQLLQRTPQDDDDDDYPQLRRWLARVEHGWKAAWPHSQHATTRPKIMILLHRGMEELDRQWVQFRRAHKNSQRRDVGVSPPSAEEFHDAMTWMLIQFRVECMCCDSYEEIWTTALKMTRALAKAPYKKNVTELECIKKLKPQVADGAPPLARAKDVWMRQLQQIPGFSEATARNLVRHYPTVQSLWQAYGESDNPEELVAGCLHEKTYQQKKAESIHRLLTSQNPEEFI